MKRGEREVRGATRIRPALPHKIPPVVAGREASLTLFSQLVFRSWTGLYGATMITGVVPGSSYSSGAKTGELLLSQLEGPFRAVVAGRAFTIRLLSGPSCSAYSSLSSSFDIKIIFRKIGLSSRDEGTASFAAAQRSELRSGWASIPSARSPSSSTSAAKSALLRRMPPRV